MADSEKQLRVEEIKDNAVRDLAREYDINESALVRRLDIKLLPAVSVLYLLSFLDRSNVANARVEGLATDLHMTGNQYLTGLTLFFVGYILFEVPWNLVLRRTSPKFWLPTVTLVWGIVATLMGLCQNLTGFFVVRFFLGVAEGALFPGVVFYLSMWYRRTERQFRIALFFSAASMAGAFGGILAYGIAFMGGVAGLGGWRWIFILEGILTCVIAVAAYYFISGWPEHSNFLSTKEKEFIIRRIELDNDATSSEGFDWAHVMDALKDYKVWLYCFAYHSLSLPLYTLSLFLPTIIKGLGYTAAQAQLLTIPPYALATILCVTVAVIAQRTRMRAPFLMACAAVAVVGYIILLANNKTVSTYSAKTNTTTVVSAHPGVSYAGVFLAAAGIYPAVAMVLSWPAVNVSGATKRATANALQITVGNLGAVIGTQLYRSQDTPNYVVGHSVALAYLCCNILIAATLWFVLGRENKRRDALQAEGKVEGRFQQGDEDVRWRFAT